MMKSSAWLFAAAMSAAGLALAQTEPKPAVQESTDPARIAEIERHAQELASRPQSTSTAPAMSEHDARQHQGARHHKGKAKHKRAMKDKAPADQPMATEGK
jgi:hypothetical protein